MASVKRTNKNGFDKLSKSVQPVVLGILQKIGQEIINAAKGILQSSNHIATGRLINSFTLTSKPGSTPTVLVGNSDDGALSVETGRRPGARMPPPQAVKDWLIAKGKDTSDQNVFLVSQLIVQRGLPAVRYFSGAIGQVQPHIQEIFNKELAAWLSAQAKGNP